MWRMGDSFWFPVLEVHILRSSNSCRFKCLVRQESGNRGTYARERLHGDLGSRERQQTPCQLCLCHPLLGLHTNDPKSKLFPKAPLSAHNFHFYLVMVDINQLTINIKTLGAKFSTHDSLRDTQTEANHSRLFWLTPFNFYIMHITCRDWVSVYQAIFCFHF